MASAIRRRAIRPLPIIPRISSITISPEHRKAVGRCGEGERNRNECQVSYQFGIHGNTLQRFAFSRLNSHGMPARKSLRVPRLKAL